ncbi:MAG: hypothetical protein U1E16_04840 [Hyphomicrobiales bacterium]
MDPRCIPDGLDDPKEADGGASCSRRSRHRQGGIGTPDVEQIDRDNILQATLRAMAQALT